MSPYNYAANNPISILDPKGSKINFFKQTSNDDKAYSGFYNKDVENAFEAYAKTEEGFNFLSKYAAKGQKIGSVSFTKNGVYSSVNLDFLQASGAYHNEGGSVNVDCSYEELTYKIKINVGHMYENNWGKEQLSLIIGHETFIHLDQYDDKLNQAYLKKDYEGSWNIIYDFFNSKTNIKDHKEYLKGNNKYMIFNIFSKELKGILNSRKVEEAKKVHDDKIAK